ncbi:MAG: phosphate ABC transporter substrate-binding protein [Sphaerochaetaceae bacterium]|nr:phosphate ABC transporter substrate-binding protein [Sphaerochaetaceae bacterium]MDD4841617.1 phosphate ABC transporter substrate-binding protein [Sphaerochaetaceae bacterium]MDD5077115.1 phosphate ABC transporter substrate-binding protein [Sphaerochaetaceae bacterium]
MKKIILVMLLITSLVSLAASGANEHEAKAVQTYTFGGSTTVAPIANAALTAFLADRPHVKITYETLGSSTGIKQLQEGTLSLAGSSRELKSSELEAGLKPIVIALDGLSVAVNSNVPIANLSMLQLSQIFAGEITNWKEVGGNDAKIEVIVRDETSGTYASFKEIVLDPLKKSYTLKAIVARENGELATKISSTPNSIGYIGMAFNHIVEESGGHVLMIDSVIPSNENVINKSYPISRSLYLVSVGELIPSVELDFVNYVLSAKGQAIVADNEFIPLP